MSELRPYQIDVLADLQRAIAAGCQRILLVAPTGSGKTVIAGAAIKQTIPKTVLVVAHRREIIAQTSAKLAGIGHGIIQAGVSPRPLERVQVASIQTLHARAVRSDRMEMPPADLIVVDEAHHAPARTYSEILAAYPDASSSASLQHPVAATGAASERSSRRHQNH
jgi:DNA repair protein RadD